MPVRESRQPGQRSAELLDRVGFAETRHGVAPPPVQVDPGADAGRGCLPSSAD
jgi:hypothetical protein